MSTDMITYSNNVPDFLKEAGGYRDEGMAAGIAPKAPKLSMTTGKQWTITDNGQTVQVQTVITNNQGQQQAIPAPSVKGVIIASSSTLTKAWYEKAFVPGTNAAPDCYSNDGKVPAPGVSKPQCANCATCPKNAFGSHPTTGRGKACGDRKLLVLALDNMPNKLATFNVPTMSLGSLREIDGKLRSNNIPLQSVMMEFTFDPGVTYPVVKIGAVGYIGKEHFEKFREAAQSDEVSAMLREADYEPAAEVAPVVPNNQIAFGTGGQQAVPKEPELTPRQKAAAALKAQLEALEAEEGEGGATTLPQMEQVTQTYQQSTPTADILGVAQASAPAGAGADTAAPAQRRRRTKAEMEAARAEQAQTGQAAPGGQTDMLAQAVGSTLAAEESAAEQVQQSTPAGAAPNVLDLLSKWAGKS